MKRVLITGAASGMGLSASALFANRGWVVMMVDKDDALLQTRCIELNAQGLEHVHHFACDVTSSESVKALHDYTLTILGGIDCVINNAGIWRGGELHQTSEDDWDVLFNVDVKSIFLTSKYFVPTMIENGGGSIINTASVSGLNGDYNMAAYNAAKGAVVNLARAMALDYGKYNIRVNNVCPSACATPMFLANPPEVVEQFNAANPLGRICTPDEVAEAMYFLASDAARSCNGVNLPVSGGLELHTGQPVQ